MKKIFFITLTLAASFELGFAIKTFTIQENKNKTAMKKVTGIGGVFFKCKDPKKITEWYQKHLGLDTNQYDATL